MEFTIFKEMVVNKRKPGIRLLILLVIIVISSKLLLSQTNYLAQKITVYNSNVSVSTALEDISKISGVKFSYNSDILNEEKTVSLNENGKSISKVLDIVTEGNLKYKVVGQHIILLPKEKQLIKSKEEKIIKLSGNVIDAETKQKIENVSVYNIGDRSSAITDSKGLYALELPENGQLTAINFSKKNYRDTTIFHEALEHLELDLALVPDRKQTDSATTSMSIGSPLIALRSAEV